MHAPEQRPHVVTELMPAGSTMAMTWTPERIGNWLFHCHVRAHVSPDVQLGESSLDHAGTHAHEKPDASAGMAGMVLGVTVVGADGGRVESTQASPGESAPARRMMLVVDPGATFDESIDHVFILGRSGPDAPAPAVLNGATTPQVAWKAGLRHRVRLINITPSDIFSVTLQTNEGRSPGSR